jgi:uncharacterized protein YdhG (YjbR/CyaY superfamily)
MDENSSLIASYLATVDDDKKVAFRLLYDTIVKNIPKGFEEQLSYGMIGFVVPHSIYPSGYHCNTKLPLPFVSIAAQKKCITLHHMGLYFDEILKNCFAAELTKYSEYKIELGKGCIRFKKWDQLPIQLITDLIQKISVADYITLYEGQLKK